LGKRRIARGDMFADAAHGQSWNGHHSSTSVNDAHSRALQNDGQLGASLGANQAGPVTQ
jgi:hypothetical protein